MATLQTKRNIVVDYYNNLYTRNELSARYRLSPITIRGILLNHSRNGKFVAKPHKHKTVWNLPGERWKPINLNTKSHYEVSSLGRLRNLQRKKIVKGVLKQGYLVFSYYENEKKKSMLLHMLVAKTFLPQPRGFAWPKYVVEHKNNNKLDNRASNLKIVKNAERDFKFFSQTRLKNIERAQKIASRTGKGFVLMPKDIVHIKKRVLRTKEYAIKYNVSEMTIARIQRGLSYGRIAPHLNRPKKPTPGTPLPIVKQIKKELQRKKLLQTQIAKKFNVTTRVVMKIKNRQTYKNV